jgi:hypothetical protein
VGAGRERWLGFGFASAVGQGNERRLLPFRRRAGVSRRNEIIAGARRRLVTTPIGLQQIASGRFAPLDQCRKPGAVLPALLERAGHARRDQAIHLLLDRLVLAPPVLKCCVTHSKILGGSSLQLKLRAYWLQPIKGARVVTGNMLWFRDNGA